MYEKSFKVYIYRILKKIHPEIHIAKVSTDAINSIISILSKHIVNKSLLLTLNENKKTISSNEIKTSTNLLLSDYKNITEFASTAETLYEKSEQERKNAPVEKPQTRESRSGLIISVSAVEKFLRQSNYHVSSTAPVYLAGVIEHIITELLNKAGNITKESKRITVTIRHLFLAVSQIPNLNTLLPNLGVVFLQSGVEPQTIENKKHRPIRRRRIVKVAQSEQESQETPVHTPHRWRSGTKTIMEIRRLQKTTDTLIQHAPFKRLVKQITALFTQTKLRFTGEFFSALQGLTEDRIISLMKSSNRLASHANRETVYSRDITLAGELTGLFIRKNEVDTLIPEATLRHLALRAGIQRYGDCCTDTYRDYIFTFLSSCLRDIVMCSEHHKVQTLNTKIFLEAMNMKGIYPTITPKKRKAIKKEETSQVPELSDIEEEAAN